MHLVLAMRLKVTGAMPMSFLISLLANCEFDMKE